MILADTSVWVDHLRKENATLIKYLEEGRILIHPMIAGELALGSLKKRDEFLAMIDHLPPAEIAENEEVFSFIEHQKLYSKGIGWVDVSLIVSAKLSHAELYTLDKRLKNQWDLLN